MRRGHVAPQNTFLDTIIRKFEGQSKCGGRATGPPQQGRAAQVPRRPLLGRVGLWLVGGRARGRAGPPVRGAEFAPGALAHKEWWVTLRGPGWGGCWGPQNVLAGPDRCPAGFPGGGLWASGGSFLPRAGRGAAACRPPSSRSLPLPRRRAGDCLAGWRAGRSVPPRCARPRRCQAAAAGKSKRLPGGDAPPAAGGSREGSPPG